VTAGFHRETANMRDIASTWPPAPVQLAEPQFAALAREVVAEAREYYRTDGDTHHELMDAVQRLEESYEDYLARPTSCFCGTGHEHERGAGYHCRPKDRGVGDVAG
jgi:hypothetical protein